MTNIKNLTQIINRAAFYHTSTFHGEILTHDPSERYFVVEDYETGDEYIINYSDVSENDKFFEVKEIKDYEDINGSNTSHKH